jgi:hypothetical protein
MRTPLALPLTWQKVLRRVAPEIAALVVYLVMALAALILVDTSGYPWVDGAAWGYLVAAAILTIVPLSMAASSLASERQMGTLDALILAPVDRKRLVWGRYWNCVMPWTRFIAWLLPIYIVLFLSRPIEGGSAKWLGPSITATMCGLGSKPALGFMILDAGDSMALRFELQALCVAVRPLRDFVSLLFVTGMGLYCSARCRTRTAALALALSVTPLLLGTLLSAAEWVMILSGRLPGVADIGAGYFFWSIVTVLVEVLLGIRLASSVARNFDRFMLREETAVRNGL